MAWSPLVALLVALGAGAEPDENGLSAMSLEDLMEVPVAVALPSNPRCLPQVPGVVTVITRSEILQSGARDLIDVLSLVPGFQPAVDVQGIIGFGVRGNWGHEGKVLFLLDGLELNELDYSTAVVGGRLPLDQIERIEVIRGPGSAVYGGYAELAVVNLITRSAADGAGASLATTLGVTRGSLTRRAVSVFAAAPVAGVDDLDVSVGAFLGQGELSDRPYVDLAGRRAEMAGNSSRDPGYLNLAVRYGETRARLVVDQYRTSTIDGFGDALPAAVPMDFPTYLADVRTRLELGHEVALHPRFSFKRQLSWRVTDPASPFFTNRYVERYTGSLHGTWNPLPALHVLVGTDATFDRAGLIDRRLLGLHRPYSNGKAAVAYQDVATLGQVAWTNPVVALTAGLRHEFHSATGHSWVPRLDLTRSFDRLHVKLLYAHAFRAPGVQNLAINPDLSPERTIVAQAEVAATLGSHLLVSTSGFFTSIRQPIVFRSSEEGGAAVERYENGDRTGSWGGDLTVHARHPRAWANLAWSFYSPRGLNEVDAYSVPGHPEQLLAFAAHKFTLNGALNVTERLFVSPSLLVLGPRYAREAPGPAGEARARRYGPTVLVHLYVGLRNVLFPGLHVGVGAYNLLDADAAYIQPYDSGHAPLPGASREFVGRVEYTTAL